MVVSIWTCIEEKIKLIKQWQRLTLTIHWIIKQNLRALANRIRLQCHWTWSSVADTETIDKLFYHPPQIKPSTHDLLSNFGLKTNLMFCSTHNFPTHKYIASMIDPFELKLDGVCVCVFLAVRQNSLHARLFAKLQFNIFVYEFCDGLCAF